MLNHDSRLSVTMFGMFVAPGVLVDSSTVLSLKPFVPVGVNQLILLNQSVRNTQETADNDPI